jgi:hypothetical protein
MTLSVAMLRKSDDNGYFIRISRVGSLTVNGHHK